MDYQTAIVISSHVDESGGLDALTTSRVEKGMDLYLRSKALSLTLSGGEANGAFCPHANSMEKYLLEEHSEDIDRQSIFLEPKSLDTVGQAVFTKTDIVVPHGFRDLAVISCEYQIPRVRRIFDFVYGDDFNLTYFESPNEPGLIGWMREAENNSLEAFTKTFNGVSRGDTDSIVARLFSAHPLYKP